ncbi:hypothetical protein ASG22_09255 [Chryseobacterium sp. Leaf405]|uniref:hypothetical protein n=1 Tax=Chryseobacterium sp. Leaf405 TaxID=1736367 RepID=UPI0006FB430B|nr:hypothetical protein [Chryseobacterium sp. Leaf405]KQT24192.1 hypothetical protein ASG22_09255 [Chryseobacterium sp. Leaf405]
MKADAKCIVNVRSKQEWRGEFAFDWFREGNSALLDDVDYNEIVGKYYQYNEREILKKLEKNNGSLPKDVFITDPNKWYTVETDIDKNPTGAKEFFKKDPQYLPAHDSLDKLKQMYQAFSYTPKGGGEKIYYASVIGLFPENEKYGPIEATLDMHIEFLTDEKPDYLIFKVDGVEITDQHPIIGLSRYKIENPNTLEPLTIKCKARSGKYGAIELFYNTTKAIQIYSVKNQTENLAGVIKFINTTAVKKKKILIIKVQTSEGVIGKPEEGALSKFEGVLNQCMLQPEFLTMDKNGKEIRLNISTEKYKFIEKCHVSFDKNKKIFIMNDKDNELGEMLLNELKEQFPDYLGSEYFRLYFLDVISQAGNSIERGYSSPNSNYGIMFKTHDPETIAHECLHGLGLSHTFSFNTKHYGDDIFNYKAQATKNIMDYSSMKNNPVEAFNRKPNTYVPKEEYYLYYWQWKKVNKNIQ